MIQRKNHQKQRVRESNTEDTMCWTEYGRVFVHSSSHHGRWRGQWSMHSHEGDEEDVLGYTRVYSWMHAGKEYARIYSEVVRIYVHTHY